ncbi:MAG: Rieske 2Fe-2S domain-containing protein [Leptolyngbya sp. SIO1E4]|nr:Rieske 2Fe-2S domain-containing protein [Leptolyngbya sp. SIO1E4]
MTQLPVGDRPAAETTVALTFNFFQHWYPVSPIEDLDPTRPTAITVLGLRFVIWKPKGSTSFRIFRDRCPHRLAPLSQGRIDESGHLMCSYHGWQFDIDGHCASIPQAENATLVEQQRDHYCATPYPVREANDLLWLWPDAESLEQAESTPLPLSPQVDASKGFVWSSVVRDLEYDWQTLVENVCDPSHVPFAHHGVQGNRQMAQPIPMTVTSSTPAEILVETGGQFRSTITFQPPCRLEYAIQFGRDKQVGLVTYCVPISPGKSRIVAQFPRNFARTLLALIPRWWDHINNRNLVLDGDMVLLHYQERELLQTADLVSSWKQAYKMPASADRLVIEFRRWFDRHCQGQLPWKQVGLDPQLASPTTDAQIILDRYKQHTTHCSSCRGALTAIRRWQFGLVALAGVLVMVTALLPDAGRVQFGLPLAGITIVALGVYLLLKYWLEPKFYYVDYVHADR